MRTIGISYGELMALPAQEVAALWEDTLAMLEELSEGSQ